MTLKVVESSNQIRRYQAQLDESLAKALPERAVRTIGHPGGRRENVTVYTNGSIYYYGGRIGGEGIPRYRNWFGRMREKANLSISFEANIPMDGYRGQVQGFFAEEDTTGAVYLMHSGGVGGGKKGVGKRPFLAWLGERPIAAIRDYRSDVHGIIVMPVLGPSILEPAKRYMRLVDQFKEAVRQRDPAAVVPQDQLVALDDYYREAARPRSGRRRSTKIDYVSRHGDVVDALKAWRSQKPIPPGARFSKNVFVDLCVSRRRRIIELYEVKTSATRFDTYGAIGQLMVHAGKSNPSLFLVLPQGNLLASDVLAALKRLKVSIVRYTIQKDGIRMEDA